MTEALEELFKHRFTNEDPEYAAAAEIKPVPVIFPWYSTPKRCYDFVARADQCREGNKRRGNWRDYDGKRRKTENDQTRERKDHNFVFVPKAEQSNEMFEKPRERLPDRGEKKQKIDKESPLEKKVGESSLRTASESEQEKHD